MTAPPNALPLAAVSSRYYGDRTGPEKVVPPDRVPAGAPMGRLRGADVQVDIRRVRRAALLLALVSFLILAGVFTVAGVRKNDQLRELQTHGVPIDATVTSCVGLLGGSGTNFVGYSCTGIYTVAGKHYAELLPGTARRAQGAVVPVVVAPSDPALISTAALVSSERTSWSVFTLPALLFLAAVLLSAVMVLGRRSRSVHGE